MEAREFLEKWKRICNSFDSCTECPFKNNQQCIHLPGMMDMDLIFEFVENYHSKTRKDALLEKYPRAILMDGDVPKACPNNLDSDYDCSIHASCMKCREEYWNEAVI